MVLSKQVKEQFSRTGYLMPPHYPHYEIQRRHQNEPKFTSLFESNFTLKVTLPANIFPNKLAPKVPNNIPRNPPFHSFILL